MTNGTTIDTTTTRMTTLTTTTMMADMASGTMTMEAAFGEIALLRAQMERFERKLDDVLAARQTKSWYTTAEVVERQGVAEDTVREWCRFGRIHAEKRKSGQGPARPWMIAHAELERLSNEGLLPLRIARD
jgi:hypothetical protein